MLSVFVAIKISEVLNQVNVGFPRARIFFWEASQISHTFVNIFMLKKYQIYLQVPKFCGKEFPRFLHFSWACIALPSLYLQQSVTMTYKHGYMEYRAFLAVFRQYPRQLTIHIKKVITRKICSSSYLN